MIETRPALTEAELEARRLARAERRQARRARNAARLAQFVAVSESILQGRTTQEVAKLEGLSKRRIGQILLRHGFRALAPRTRRFVVDCGERRANIVTQLSREAGVPPSIVVEKIIASVVDDGLPKARKRLAGLKRAVSRREVRAVRTPPARVSRLIQEKQDREDAA